MAVDVQKWFDEDFGAGLVRHADEARKVETKFQVSITGEGGGEWWVDPSAGKVERGNPGGASLTMVMDASTFAKVYDAPKSGLTQGFFAGHVKMTGNTAAAEKFADLLQLAKQ
ncbi:SCP2 sterol-binding domain-containing protein [Streptomyces hirsutus]|uniref:SCP2 sterol-binding domain-containing protein n=1 Tax=Streptomyces hirsutus TaxID=35620 RepID=UPI0036361AA8